VDGYLAWHIYNIRRYGIHGIAIILDSGKEDSSASPGEFSCDVNRFFGYELMISCDKRGI
jgi:hypothetical protein